MYKLNCFLNVNFRIVIERLLHTSPEFNSKITDFRPPYLHDNCIKSHGRSASPLNRDNRSYKIINTFLVSRE